ncbi:hypothetical protein Ddye_013641 [Dipteronia dyeriana]|uniref:Reverse transcriptase zinc-binding domain-containing protein n=1 Tax=Dipteronia dyeriana TaxID=168575 RepID=A0AAE0CJU3_9ROSI|nr:hypothetical protein Ddye_013641 [Dipteronia dyeriana]
MIACCSLKLILLVVWLSEMCLIGENLGLEEELLYAGGKEILVKAVILSIPTYAMSLFRLPQGKIKEVERLCARLNCLAFDNTGEYTVRSGYIVGCDVLDSPTTSGLNDAFSWWKLLWRLNIPLKVKLFVWRACNNWIPTMVNLEGRGLRVSSRCPVCDYGRETTWHALWGCKKHKPVRESMLVAQHIGSDIDLCDVVVWSEAFVSDYSKANEVGRQTDSQIPKKNVVWQPPCIGRYQLNTNAAIDTDGKIVGFGAVIRDSEGMSMTYQELVLIMQTVVKYDVDKYSIDLQSISMVSGTTCRTFIRNNDDVQFMLWEDRVILQVCVSLIERATGGVIDEQIPHRDNTQQFRSSGGSKQMFIERSGIDGQENLYGVPPKVVDQGELVGPQFDDVFGCQIEMNDGQFNHHYNDMNNEQNNEPNVRPIHEVDDEENLHPIDNIANNEEEKEVVELERCARRVHRFSYSATYIAGTFVVRPNVTPYDYDNVTTERNLDFTSLCVDYYKRQTLIDVSSIPNMHVGHPFSWVVPDDIVERVILNPLSRRQAGHPIGGRHVSSSERTATQSRRRCGHLGHNSMSQEVF